MRIPAHPRQTSAGFNMTPMIDVVFLLIIFFLVSSHLAKQEVQLELPLPIAESGEVPAPSDARRLTLNVLAGGELRMFGRRVTRDQVRARLDDARRESGNELEVRIRSDRGVPYQHVEQLMLACARAGIWNVTFGVFERK